MDREGRVQDGRRQWWLAALGAAEDSKGIGEIGRTWSEAGHAIPGKVTQLRVRSYGYDLESLCFTPEELTTDAVVVVPFYEVWSALDTPPPDGVDVPPRQRSRGHARALAARGMKVIVVPWRFEALALANHATADKIELDERYGPAARKHQDESDATGFGRSLADLSLVLTAAHELGMVPGRIGVFGHSLGGKLALGLTALDERVNAGVSHEPGLGFAHSNWSAPWYLGDMQPTDRDLDDLLTAVAPRPFLLIGGGASDGEHNARLAR